MFPGASCEVQDPMLQIPIGKPVMPARWKPNNVEPAPNCPRCASPNTKFCYYNNYSLSQPRYFCKACRRYWTKGGFLRNVPVGGGSRKSRRSKAPSHPLPPIPSAPISSPSDDVGHSLPHHNQSQEATGSDIDMALMFAKFLSSAHDSNHQAANGGSSSSNSKHCLTPESVEAEAEAEAEAETESQAPQPSDPVAEGLPPQVQNFAEEGVMSGIDELEWEGLLGDGCGTVTGTVDHEVVQDVFWSDATTSSSVTWQPPLNLMHLQEDLVEYPIPLNYDEDAQLPITDPSWTWSSFDFSTLQLFSSRP